jgi:hypothetical protein
VEGHSEHQCSERLGKRAGVLPGLRFARGCAEYWHCTEGYVQYICTCSCWDAREQNADFCGAVLSSPVSNHCAKATSSPSNAAGGD